MSSTHIAFTMKEDKDEEEKEEMQREVNEEDKKIDHFKISSVC